MRYTTIVKQLDQLENRIRKIEGEKPNVFQIGEIVVLKSGSPTMTVNLVLDHTIQCTWFVDGRVQTDQFHKWMLEHWEPLIY